MKPDVLIVGQRVKNIRKAANVTHKQLAKSIGMSEEWVRRLEAGMTLHPSMELLWSIGEACGFDVQIGFKAKPVSQEPH